MRKEEEIELYPKEWEMRFLMVMIVIPVITLVVAVVVLIIKR